MSSPQEMDRIVKLQAPEKTYDRYKRPFLFQSSDEKMNTMKSTASYLWKSPFMQKSHQEKRRIMRNPSDYPLAAYNLAAVTIQRIFRGGICRSGTRFTKTKRAFMSPMQKFITFYGGTFDNVAAFHDFAAKRIQMSYRNRSRNRRHCFQSYAHYQIAALQIQYFWKLHKNRENTSDAVSLMEFRGALTIQQTWRGFRNRRIFQYYRDLITFRDSGSPMAMLRAINASEASLLDGAMGAHVRFRLGGCVFPPKIYYKIYTKRPVCDLNAFSPKDYTQTRKLSVARRPENYTTQYLRVGRALHCVRRYEMETETWYKRLEHNGWRCVTPSTLEEASRDPVCATNRPSRVSVEYVKIKNSSELKRLRKERKLKWMRNMYHEKFMGQPFSENDRQKEYENDKDIDFDSIEWEEHAQDMCDWAAALDYDGYKEDWKIIGTSANSYDALSL